MNKAGVPWDDRRPLPDNWKRVTGSFRQLAWEPIMKAFDWDRYVKEKTRYRLLMFMQTKKYRAMRSAFMKGRYTLEEFTDHVWDACFGETHEPSPFVRAGMEGLFKQQERED